MKTIHPIIIGIDTHKASHVAVAIDTQGTRLAALSIPTNPKGYLEVERWARSFGKVPAFGIEETGSYGAVSSMLRAVPKKPFRVGARLCAVETACAVPIVLTSDMDALPLSDAF